MNNDTPSLGNTPLLAAIDLGSNSFHMVVARVEHGEARIVERMADTVQLASGFSDDRLSGDAMERGLACLSRFRQALDVLNPDEVRVVGTNALRAARNGNDFRHRAQAVIGCPVEVVSGREEARLVYLGVAHTLADDDRRLVVDIGGGSTEFIIGERFEPRLMESLHMGCVSYGERFFGDGKITRKQFDRAYFAAYNEVLNIAGAYKRYGWQNAVGSSGTLRSLEGVIAAQGWAGEGITADNLVRLRKRVLDFNSMKELCQLAGLSERRRNVFASGLAITCAFFDALGIETLQTSTGALREGVLYDLIGRHRHEDVRGRSVSALMQRYNVEDTNATHVEAMCHHLFDRVSNQWNLGNDELELLTWAARLHEIGLAISHSGFHKHGQYLAECSDLPGFSSREQVALGLLIRGHRRKFPVKEFELKANGDHIRLTRLCLLLRLAVIFKFVAAMDDSPDLRIATDELGLTLQLPSGWLEHHPLTHFALESEQELLARAGYSLKLEARNAQVPDSGKTH